ncbi:putative retrotransposon hot spot protein (RHS) [Trypanosoma cruzi]|uniref:Putative retrotransposon hot spot protein (RHS) n=1 Tax=Trypanosoma cruzi TaxID=5693 RepID=A0A2V2UVP9_TRYCR|nr:putative retrotransposon hot spot protein (RHS) [Trypanosoma cruzi]
MRTDHRAVRVPRLTPLGLRDGTAASVLGASAPAGRSWACDWDASPHGCCGGTSPCSCDGSDAAARRVAGSKVWPRWTMSSTVEEILRRENTSSTNMILSDFLWNYVGGRAAVDEGYNVTMEVFVQEPDDCVQDQRLLEEILHLTAHQALEAITNLFTKVCSLGQRRTMKEKHTITPLARGKPNGVLTQVLDEARRAAEERLRRTQDMKFTISTNIEDVLFKGRARVKEMKLSDFLTRELDGMGIVDTTGCLAGRVFQDPTKYIRDKGALNEIQASGHY